MNNSVEHFLFCIFMGSASLAMLSITIAMLILAFKGTCS